MNVEGWGRGLPGGSVVKNVPAVLETQVRSLDQEDPLEEDMATHSSVLAWRIPWTEEPCGLHAVHGVPKRWIRLSDSTATVTGIGQKAKWCRQGFENEFFFLFTYKGL